VKYYFAYGSNLWRHQMQERCPEHQVYGLGSLNNYRWIISLRGVANIIKSKGDRVFGIVYMISLQDEERLDECEGVDEGCYTKETLPVDVNGASLDCLVYEDPIEEKGSPRAKYISKINMGIADAALPQDYVNRYIRMYIPMES